MDIPSEKIVELKQEKKNIHQRILSIMEELSYIQRGDAKVNGQYKFVSHDQVTGAVHPLLVKYGVTIIPTVQEVNQETNRTSVKLAVCFFNADDPTDCLTCSFCGYGIDAGDKGPGKAISYAYKYALLKTFCLETGDDPDTDATAVFEVETCSEFDAISGSYSGKDKTRLEEFLCYSGEVTNKHVEDVKREAIKRPESFKKSFEAWCKKK